MADTVDDERLAERVAQVCYQPSGKWAAKDLPRALVWCVVGGAGCGVGYAYATWYNPLFFIPFDLAILDDIYSQGWAAAGAAERILTGLDVTREVRWAGITSRSGGALPIIGATGKECESHNTQAIEAGQCVVWGKPSPGREEMERDLRLALSDVLSGRASGPRQG